ncbi:hypothetical protein KP509_14G055800 [Ceratopteris richardii]|uniref:Riboflavin synthase n=1 Tax=Ceratopteris richardii TaxID=49495 RepID=A0A8T2TCY5_CERRI|nr:hypothetical protein KP509_14G055800 [Ceratopteris richardii]
MVKSQALPHSFWLEAVISEIKSHHLYHPQTKRILVSRDVVFVEDAIHPLLSCTKETYVSSKDMYDTLMPLFTGGQSSVGPNEATSQPLQYIAPHVTIIIKSTGIVEELGIVADVGTVKDGFEMTINASVALDGVKLGDSIVVNGTCLTITRFDDNSFSVDLALKTLRRTSLGDVVPGSLVNLERSLQPTSHLGGHFVQGHVDGTGTIVSMDKENDSLWVKVKTSADILQHIVTKGYIIVDGTSLIVVNVFDDELAFNFMLVSYMQQKIVVPLKSMGSNVNLEVDIMGKYVERLLVGYTTRPVQT